MKNLANVLAILLLVVALGLMAGCGCGTANDRTNENMVGNTTGTPETNDSTMQEDLTTTPNNVNENKDHYDADGNLIDENGNIIEENNTITPDANLNNDVNPIDGSTINDGTGDGVIEDAGNAVGDVIDGVGDAVKDVGNGVKDATR